jgi:peptidoglycan/xylan/chitin deacetylase (PgdA/CDA1 family)
VKSKKNFLSKIRKIAKSNKNINFDTLVNMVQKKIKFNKSIKSSNSILDKKMTWKQINLIKSDPLFLIGGHTKSHPILSFCDYRKCKSEIEDSIKRINSKTDINLKHYSYPEGFSHTYGKREITILKKNKIKICPSSEFGFNDSKSNLFYLKRIFVEFKQ